ncbi:hypothetical protein Tco_1082908 [Tanacetum coccineum]|uniref:Uncharacterized protein n=1 Tax=Tanacetum coccineum TaxID=301880 RepID=A0ABQ5I1Z3_9ASTR
MSECGSLNFNWEVQLVVHVYIHTGLVVEEEWGVAGSGLDMTSRKRWCVDGASTDSESTRNDGVDINVFHRRVSRETCEYMYSLDGKGEIIRTGWLTLVEDMYRDNTQSDSSLISTDERLTRVIFYYTDGDFMDMTRIQGEEIECVWMSDGYTMCDTDVHMGGGRVGGGGDSGVKMFTVGWCDCRMYMTDVVGEDGEGCGVGGECSACGSWCVIMEHLVKINAKAHNLELKQRHLKNLFLTTYTPYPSRRYGVSVPALHQIPRRLKIQYAVLMALTDEERDMLAKKVPEMVNGSRPL